MKTIIFCSHLFVVILLGIITPLSAQTIQQDTLTANQLLEKAKADLSKAVIYCQEAETLYRKWKQWDQVFLAQRRIADAQIKNRDFNAAEVTFLAMLDEIPKQLKLPNIAEARAYSQFGELYRTGLRKPDKAVEFLQKAVDWYLVNEGQDSKSLIPVYSNLGLVNLFDLRAYQSAMDYLMKALAVNNKNYPSSHISTAHLYNKIATTYRYQGNPHKALEFFKKAAIIIEKAPEENASLLQSNYNNSGATYMDIGQMDKAIQSFQKCIEVHQKSKMPINELYLIANGNIADCYSIAGDYEKALAQYKNTYAQIEQAYGRKHVELAHICNNIVVAFFKNEQADSALVYAQKGIVANVIGFDEMDYHKTPSTENFHYLDGLELLYAIANKADALITIYEKSKNIQDLLLAFDAIELSMVLFDKMEEASKNASDKIYLYQNMQYVFQIAIDICNSLYHETKETKYQQRAFEIAENNKAALLRQSLQEDNAKQFGGIPDSLLRLEQKIKEQLAYYENQWTKSEVMQDKEAVVQLGEKIFEEKKQYQSLQKQFEKDFPNYYELKYDKKILNIKALQQSLSKEEVLVSYFWNEPRFYAFVVLPDTFYIVQQKLPKLKAEVDSLFQIIFTVKLQQENPSLYHQLFNKYGYSLYQSLIEKLSLPTTVQKLIIIPDGSLYYIPFEALIQQPNKDETNPKWNYLVNKYAISYVYSAALWEQLRNTQKESYNADMLAFAPAYDKNSHELATARSRSMQNLRKKLMALSGAQEEVRRLEQIFQGKFYYDNQANESVLKKEVGNYGILHFAMHGILDSKSPTNSSLAFTETGDTLEDNFLHAYEVNNLKLNAQLVVLSACETGHGKFASGEGVMSLARSFMYAGASSVVATLWQVNDASTTLLMAYFYENIKKGMDKATALQQAKLTYLSQTKHLAGHPSFWAAPVLIGDSAPVIISSKKNWLWRVLGLGVIVVVGAMVFRKK